MSDADASSLHADVELSRLISEAEKAAFEAKLSELEVQRKELELLESQINMDYQLNGTFTFHHTVEKKSMNRLFRQMRIWHKYNPTGEWTIHMNSTGGSAYASWGIIDELAAHSIQGGGTHQITIKVRGVAASAAGMILQAADHRIMGRNGMLMIHKGSLPGFSGTADDIKDEHEWWERCTDAMVELFLRRSGGRIGYNEFMERIDRRDWWLSAEEAVEMGFADAIG